MSKLWKLRHRSARDGRSEMKVFANNKYFNVPKRQFLEMEKENHV